MSVFPFQMLGDFGDQTGQQMQQSNNKALSNYGGIQSAGMNPIKATLTSISRGDNWKDVLGTASLLGAGLANQKYKKNNEVSLVDEGQKAFLDEINRKREALKKGTDYQYDLANKQNAKNLATTQNAVLKSGSDIGSVMTGLNSAQKGAGEEMNQATGYLLNKAEAYDARFGEQVDKIAERKLNLQFNKYLQDLHEKSNKEQANQQNLMGAAAYLMGNMGNKGQSSGSSYLTPPANNTATTNTQNPNLVNGMQYLNLQGTGVGNYMNNSPKSFNPYDFMGNNQNTNIV